MKVIQVGALATTIASLSASAYGYTFADTAKEEDTTTVESTGLTTNEESRIYGGTEANIDKYPFLASLRDTLFEMNMCGGTLIAPQYILTAGHCIKTDEMDMIATFGTNESAGSGLTVPIIEGFRHPMYKKKEHLYDVGLLKLKKPVKRKMAKLCAKDGSDNKVGTMGTVLGWGKTETSGELGSPTLRELTVPVISNAECAKFKKYVGRVTEGMLCAGTGNGKDTCNGDSGGPLIVDDDIIIGCVSWGSKCGEQAGIYTRLTYVMDYIEDILAGGDGSKFNVTASSSGSTEEDVSLPSSSEGSADEESSESGSAEDTADQTTKKSKGTKTPAVEEDSESGSDDLSWLVETVSGSGSDAGLVKVPDWLLKYFGGSGSGSASDLSWLFASNSDSGSESATGSESTSEGSGSEDAVLAKGKTKATKTTKAPVVEDSESGSDDLSWLLDSDSGSDTDSESGSEDAVLVKGKTKVIKATKAPLVEEAEDSPFQQTSVEDESASTSASTSGSESDDVVHQSDLS